MRYIVQDTTIVVGQGENSGIFWRDRAAFASSVDATEFMKLTPFKNMRMMDAATGQQMITNAELRELMK